MSLRDDIIYRLIKINALNLLVEFEKFAGIEEDMTANEMRKAWNKRHGKDAHFSWWDGVDTEKMVSYFMSKSACRSTFSEDI